MRLVLRAITGSLLVLAVLGVGAVPSEAAGWTGRYSVYAQGSFSYQHLDYTCVGASVQMMLNMISGTTRHSASAQKVYWQYGRTHSRYVSKDNGVDPVGWVAALEHFGAGNYSINVATSYQAGLRALARRMRATGKPIGLTVHHGDHAWVTTGFAATADPLTSASFKVTAVQVMGPLYPDGTLGGRHYDPGPGTWLSASALRKKFNPFQWNKAPEWDGRWVAVVPG